MKLLNSGILFLVVTFMMTAGLGYAREVDSLENLLSKQLNDLRNASKDNQKKELNASFHAELEKALQHDWAFEFPFTQLKTIGKITSQDKNVRVFSWNVQWESGKHTYYCFILKKNRRGNSHTVIPLEDNSIALPPQPTETLDEDNWYGALYYDIIDVQKGRKTYYTLFGYDAKNNRSTVKLLDVLHFAGNSPKFGYPLFNTNEGVKKRVYFEHAAKTVMSLRYDQQREMIIFDHLSPESPGLAEFREFYVPDMSYDAFVFENNKWQLREDVIANNSTQRESKELVLRNYDSESDDVMEISVQNKWVDPTDRNSPIDSGKHRAVKPEDQEQANTPSSKKKAKKKQKDNTYNGVSYSNLPTKKKKSKKK